MFTETLPGMAIDAGAVLGGHLVRAIGDFLVKDHDDFPGPIGDAGQSAADSLGLGASHQAHADGKFNRLRVGIIHLIKGQPLL